MFLWLPAWDARGGRRVRRSASSCSPSAAVRRRSSRWSRRGSGRVGHRRPTIRQLELSAFLARVYGPAHDFDAAVLGVPGDAGLAYLGPLAAVAGLAAPPDPAAAQRMFADSVPVAFLYHARGLQGMNRRVHGVTMDLRGELPTVHDWWVAP